MQLMFISPRLNCFHGDSRQNATFDVYFNQSALTRASTLSAVILNSSRRLSLLAVCVGVLSETCVSQAGKQLLGDVRDAWTLAGTPLD